MRIIVDQWVLKDQRADKNIMSLIVHNHINSLNVIYEKNVRVKDDRQLRSHIDVFRTSHKKHPFFFNSWFPHKMMYLNEYQLLGVIFIATHIPNLNI